MNDKHVENAVRLLDIVYDLFGGTKGYPIKGLPFSIDEAGKLSLHKDLERELSKKDHGDLLQWSKVNIKDLFE